MRRKLEPVSINLEAKELAKALTGSLDLTGYERQVLNVLLAAPRPFRAREITYFCEVPRSKVYYTLRRLVDNGLVVEYKRLEDEVDKPPIYEYWPDRKKREWRTTHDVGILFFAPNVPYLKDLYLTWSTEFYSRKLAIGKLLDLLEARP